MHNSIMVNNGCDLITSVGLKYFIKTFFLLLLLSYVGFPPIYFPRSVEYLSLTALHTYPDLVFHK